MRIAMESVRGLSKSRGNSLVGGSHRPITLDVNGNYYELTERPLAVV